MIVLEGYGQTLSQQAQPTQTIAQQAQQAKSPSFWESLKTTMSDVVAKLPLDIKLGKYTIQTGGGRIAIEKGAKVQPVQPVIQQVAPQQAGVGITGILPIIAIGGAIAVIIYLISRK